MTDEVKELIDAAKVTSAVCTACFRVIYEAERETELFRELEAANVQEGFGARIYNAIAAAERAEAQQPVERPPEKPARTLDQIHETGSAWCTETEFDRICNRLKELEARLQALHRRDPQANEQ